MARQTLITASAIIPAPPDRVRAIACGTSRYPEWVENTLEVIRTDGPTRSGASYEELTRSANPPQRNRQQHTGAELALSLPGGHPLLEYLQIQFAVLNAQQVPGRAGQQPRRTVPAAEDLAQPGDLHPQHPLRRSRRLIAQQLIDQLVPGDHAVGVAQQQRQQRALPRPADVHQRSAEPDLQRPEDPEFQPSVHVTPHPSPPRPVVLASRGLRQP